MVVKIDGKTDAERIERRKCQTDLYYLASEYLGYDLVEKVHRPICEFFVHKDPYVYDDSKGLYVPTGKAFEDWDVIKDRLLLDPREHYKTTIDVADAIQYIICWPDIRIAFFSGTEDLTKEIVQMLIRQFQFNNKFKNLFFEHAIEESKKMNTFDFTTPAAANWKQRGFTVATSTIASVSTGTHYEVIKFDDVITPQNSETPDMVLKTKNRIADAIPLVMQGGYRDFIGTIYDHEDKYSTIIDQLEEPIVVEEIPFGEIIRTPEWKVFRREASTLPLTPQSEFLFPFRKDGRKNFDYKTLQKKRKEMGDRKFGCQYYNKPTWGDETSFSEELIEKAIYPANAIPLISKEPMSGQWFRAAKVFIAVDLAFSTKKQAHLTAIVVGAFDLKGRCFIVDGYAGKFDPYELVVKLLTMIKKWQSFLGRVAIEEAAGSRLIEPALKSAGFPTGIIDWVPTSPERIKQERISGLLPLIKTGKLMFASDLEYLDILKQHFIRFPRGKDDVPDAIALLIEKYQTAAAVPAPVIEQPQALFEPQTEPSNPLGFGIIG